jgi:hypothetical protein
MSQPMRGVLAVLIAVIGTAALGVGILYLTVAAGALPSFVPGHVVGAVGKHPTRGYVAIVVGAALIVVALALPVFGSRRSSLR